jgi:MFS family permease
MFRTLFQRNFALLWFGGLISMSGDWMLFIARPIFVYQMTDSTLATSLMFIAGMLPRIFFGSLAGVFVDRWERKRTMVVTNLLLAAGLLPLLLVRSPEMLWILYLSALIQSSIAQFLYPAENAMLPTLVDEQYLPSANALNSLNNNLARLGGPAIGGLLMASVGFEGVILADAATYLTAALMTAAITVTSKPERAALDSLQPSVIWKEWRDGLRVVRQNQALLVLFILMAITSVGEGIFGTLFVLFSTDILHADPFQVGSLMSAQAVGGLIGGAVIGWIGSRISSWRMLWMGCFFLGIFDLMLFNYPFFFTGFWFALLILMLAGIPASGAMTSTLTLLQTNTDDQYRGRVFGALTTITGVFGLIGMAFAGVMGDVMGIVPVINLQGIGYIVGGLMVLFLQVRETRKLKIAEQGV